MEALLGNHSVQSSASVRVARLVLGIPWANARPNAVSEACSRKGKVEPALGAAARLCSRWIVGGAVLLDAGVFRCVDAARQPQRTEPCQCVSGQLWAYHGPLQGKMQPLHCGAGVPGPLLSAAAGLGRWFVGVLFSWMLEYTR